MERARGCFRHLRTLFQELEEIRPFELLKGQADRINYLMTKQAKVLGRGRACYEVCVLCAVLCPADRPDVQLCHAVCHAACCAREAG